MSTDRPHSGAGSGENAPPSKTQRKKQATELQQLGRALAELSTAERATLDLPSNLARAIDDYLRFPSHGAKRRQLQFIGRLMRNVDAERLQAALDDLAGTSAAAIHRHASVERWRERLLAEDAALEAYLDAHPAADRPALRTLIRSTRQAEEGGHEQQRKHLARKLFRQLMENETRTPDPPGSD